MARPASHEAAPIAAALALALALAGEAEAAPRLDGATFTVFSRAAVTRFPDVAHDGDAGVFLVVSGQQGITGRFVGAGGLEGESFDVSVDPMAYSPRVAAVGAAFVVCWLVEDTAAVVCRTVAPAAPAILGAEQIVTAGTVGHLESAPSLACAKGASECLVTWVDGPETAVRGRRVGLDGAPLGSAFDIAVTAGVFEAFPTVACAEARGEYFVAHTREPDAQPMAIAGQRVAVGTGASIGSSIELYSSVGLNNYPEIAHDPTRERYLAVSWLHEGNPDVAGRLVDAEGTPIGDRIAIAATRGFEGGDGIGLAFDAAAETYLSAYQGPETPGLAQQVWATAVDVDGAPAPGFQVTSGAVQNGVYQPRVASDGAGRFLVVTVVDYERVDAQFVVVDVPSGSGGTGGIGATGGNGGEGVDGPGANGSGGAAIGATAPSGDSGCGCRAARADSSGWMAVAGVAASLAALRRRRLGYRALCCVLACGGCAGSAASGRAAADLAEAREEASVLYHEAEALRADARRAEVEAQRHRAEATELKSANAELTSKVDDLMLLNVELGERLKGAGQNVEQLATERGNLRQALVDTRADLAEWRQQQQAMSARAALQRQLAGALRPLAAEGVAVGLRQGRVVITMPADQLFDPGMTAVKPAGRPMLVQLGGALRPVAGRTFRISAHTDLPRPSGAVSPSWQLSVGRALSITRELIAAGVRPEAMFAAGHAEYDPLASNAAEPERGRNRRIEIVLEPAPDELVRPAGSSR